MKSARKSPCPMNHPTLVTCGIDWARDDHAVSRRRCPRPRDPPLAPSNTAMPGCATCSSLLTKHGVCEVAIERPTDR